MIHTSYCLFFLITYSNFLKLKIFYPKIMKKNKKEITTNQNINKDTILHSNSKIEGKKIKKRKFDDEKTEKKISKSDSLADEASCNIKKNKHTKKVVNNNLTEYTPYDKNIIIVSNLSFKETENSIKECFKKYGAIERVQLTYSKDKKFIGKAIIIFKHPVFINEDIKLNYKILRIERMKNKTVNDKRIFISRLNKNLTILQLRNILKKFNIKPKDIRMRFEIETKRNIGYCHVTYSSALEAKAFEKKWNLFKHDLGVETFYEYAQEKVSKHKKNKAL